MIPMNGTQGTKAILNKDFNISDYKIDNVIQISQNGVSNVKNTAANYSSDFANIILKGPAGTYSCNSLIQITQTVYNNSDQEGTDYTGCNIYRRAEFIPFIQQCQVNFDGNIKYQSMANSFDQLAYYQTLSEIDGQILDDVPQTDPQKKRWQRIGQVQNQTVDTFVTYNMPLWRFCPKVFQKDKFFTVNNQFQINFQYIGDSDRMYALQRQVYNYTISGQPLQVNIGNCSPLFLNPEDGGLYTTDTQFNMILKKYENIHKDHMMQEYKYFGIASEIQNIQMDLQGYQSDYQYIAFMNYSQPINCISYDTYNQVNTNMIQRDGKQLLNCNKYTNNSVLLDWFQSISFRGKHQNNNVTIFTTKERFVDNCNYNISQDGVLLYGYAIKKKDI